MLLGEIRDLPIAEPILIDVENVWGVAQPVRHSREKDRIAIICPTGGTNPPFSGYI